MTCAAVTEALEMHQIAHAIIGGHAMAAYGCVRYTEDVDVIAAEKQSAAQVIAAACGHAAAVVQAGAHAVSVYAADGRRLVDVLSMDDGNACRRAVEQQVLREDLPVPPVDVLIALKFEAMTDLSRPKNRRSLDLHDIEYLVMTHLTAHVIDDGEVQRRVQGIADLVESDALGDAERGGKRWLKLYDDIRSDRDFSK